MAKNRKYQSELLGVIYEEALANFEVGAISEERLKHYERECLVPEAPHISFSTNVHHSTPAAVSAAEK